LALLTEKFPNLIKNNFANKIKVTDFGNNDKFFFVPTEKINDSTDTPSAPCTRLKTSVLLKNGKGLSNIGSIDNMPKYLISMQPGTAPMAITYTYCNTGASLWKIYPKVEEKADFSNDVGG
jgi:hypothetical protein